jgi:two-component system, chemotaxis family, CheB/CheR fusion protein
MVAFMHSDSAFEKAGEPAALSTLAVSPIPAVRHLRILVVEDNQDAAESLRMLLELDGHEVMLAYNGPAGIHAATVYHPDVVLCDIGLPGLDGYGVVHALRHNPETAPIRIIAVTAYSQDSDRRRSREAGFDLHLTKPFDPYELLQLILSTPRAG